jgi:hypothetical protein
MKKWKTITLTLLLTAFNAFAGSYEGGDNHGHHWHGYWFSNGSYWGRDNHGHYWHGRIDPD